MKRAILSKKLFSSESGYVNLGAVLPTVPEFFHWESKTILLEIWRIYSKYNHFKERFLPGTFSSMPRMDIYKHARNVRYNSPNNFFLQKQKRKKIQRNVTFFPNCSRWHVQCMFWQPCKKVLHKLRKTPLLLGKSRRHIECSS